MKVVINADGTKNLYGCTKTLGQGQGKRKLVYDLYNFRRGETREDVISEFDIVINGVNLGHARVPFSDTFEFSGITFRTEKAMLEYAESKIQ